MRANNFLTNSLVALCTLFIVGSLAQNVSWEPCTKTARERTAPAEIHQVEVAPCPAAPDGPCEIPLGSTGSHANITMDFTPNAVCGRRCRHSYWWQQESVDLPFKSKMDPKACNFFNCLSKLRQVYKATLQLNKNLPKGLYPVKVKTTNGAKVISCFVVQVRLV